MNGARAPAPGKIQGSLHYGAKVRAFGRDDRHLLMGKAKADLSTSPVSGVEGQCLKDMENA
jgi:hypothetical protein